MAPSRPCISGLPGRMATRQKPSSQALAASAGLHEVVVADRGAAEREQQIGAGRARGVDAAFERRETVARDAEVDRLAAGVADERRERERVGGDDLVGTGVLARPHELVAGRQDRDPRLAPHAQPACSWRPRARGGAHPGARPRRQAELPAVKSSPARAHVAAGATGSRSVTTAPSRPRRSPGSRWRRRPSGTGAPVKIRTASPGPTGPVEAGVRRRSRRSPQA